MSSRLGTLLVAAIAVVVLAATVAMWVDFRHQVDETVARAADAAPPSDVPSDAPTSSPSATATPTADPVVRSLWIGDGYTAQSCPAAKELGWKCRVDAQQGTGFLSDGSSFDADFATVGDRLADLPRKDPDVVVVDAGRNDLGVYATAAVLDAMDGYLAALRERYPDAVLVQVVPWTRADPTPDPEVAQAVVRLMDEYDGHALDPAGTVLVGTALADAIRGLDLPVAVSGQS